MIPTETGEQAYRLFMPLLGQLLEARQTLIHRNGEISGRIHAGLIASAANQALASTLAYFVEHHPNVELQVSYGYSQNLIDRVLSGDLDFAVINQSFQQERLTRIDLVDEELLVATGAANRLRVPTPVPLSALRELKLVLPSRLLLSPSNFRRESAMSRFSFLGPCMAWGYSLPPVCNNMIPSNTRFRTSTALMPRSGKQRDISSITYVRGDSRAAELAPVLGSYWKSLNSQTSPCASLGTQRRTS